MTSWRLVRSPLHGKALQKACARRSTDTARCRRRRPVRRGWMDRAESGQLLSIDRCVVLGLHNGRIVVIDRCIEDEIRVAGLDAGWREMERCGRGLKLQVDRVRGRLGTPDS